MSLQGLPDLQRPLSHEAARILYPFGLVDDHFVLPDRLEVARRADGSPDFHLEFVRGARPDLPPEPYGLLDLRLHPHYPVDAALAILREHQPRAVAMPLVFSAGVLRFKVVGTGAVTEDAAAAPVPLAWNSLGYARYMERLDPSVATLLKRALQDELFTVEAYADLELVGVAPRVPVVVELDLRALVERLHADLAHPSGAVPWAEVVNYLVLNRDHLPVSTSAALDGDTQVREWAEAIADHLRMARGSFTPSPDGDPQPYFMLEAPVGIPAGSVRWDLSEPLVTRRVQLLRLDPIAAAREIVAERGLEAVYEETTVPALQTGFLTVDVSANLPRRRIATLETGVELRVPARPPHRMHALVETVVLRPPDDHGRAVLRLSPVEPPEYMVATYAVVRGAAGIDQLEREAVLHVGPSLRLNPDHFPVQFVPVEASAALLAQALVGVTVRWPDGPEWVEQVFELAAESPSAAVAVPRAVEGAVLEVVLRAQADESRVLTYGPVPAGGLFLDLPLFPGYGPHAVEIACEFDLDVPVFAIDLAPDAPPGDDQADPTFLFFTPQSDRKTWSWFARSPFFAGYRYRVRDEAGGAHGPWVAVPSPFEPLHIRTSMGAQIEP